MRPKSKLFFLNFVTANILLACVGSIYLISQPTDAESDDFGEVTPVIPAPSSSQPEIIRKQVLPNRSELLKLAQKRLQGPPPKVVVSPVDNKAKVRPVNWPVMKLEAILFGDKSKLAVLNFGEGKSGAFGEGEKLGNGVSLKKIGKEHVVAIYRGQTKRLGTKNQKKQSVSTSDK